MPAPADNRACVSLAPPSKRFKMVVDHEGADQHPVRAHFFVDGKQKSEYGRSGDPPPGVADYAARLLKLMEHLSADEAAMEREGPVLLKATNNKMFVAGMIGEKQIGEIFMLKAFNEIAHRLGLPFEDGHEITDIPAPPEPPGHLVEECVVC